MGSDPPFTRKMKRARTLKNALDHVSVSQDALRTMAVMFFTRFEYFDGFYVDGPTRNEWFFSPPSSELYPLVRMLRHTPFIDKVTFMKDPTWVRSKIRTKYFQDQYHPKRLDYWLLNRNERVSK